MFLRLSALSTGYAIPQADFDAKVHSVFSHAANLQPANSDLLLTLVVAGETDLPQGIRLDTPEGFSFEPLRVGAGVFCRQNNLFFENSAWEVDFSQARHWQCNLPEMRIDITNSAVAQAWKCVWQALNAHQVRQEAELVTQALLRAGGAAQSATSRRAGEAIRDLTGATRRCQLDQSALTRLIGLGTGLTPGGDDFLVGFLAGLWCTVRDSVERRQFLARLGQEVIRLSTQTNVISRTYLYHAGQGQVSRRLEALAGAISRLESPEKLQTVAAAAMQSGHTSGMEAVTGLLFGLAGWEAADNLMENHNLVSYDL